MKNHNIISIVLLILAIIVLISALVISARADYDGPVWTYRMLQLHDAADMLRTAGYSDDSDVIQVLKDAWWREYYDLAMTAKSIFYEAGYCELDHQIYVGAVIHNRVKSDKFPNTVKEVLCQENQYNPMYANGDYEGIPRHCWEAAKIAMDGDHDAPSDLYWQAEFPQGREIWKTFYSPIVKTTTYFCRGTIYD